MGKCMICKTANKKNCGKTFHKFPCRDSNLLQKWVDNITKGIPGGDYKLGKDSLLCSEHFEESCFDRTGFRVRLNKNSIPTIFSKTHCPVRKKKKLQLPELSGDQIDSSSMCSDHLEKSPEKIRSKQSIPSTALDEVDHDALSDEHMSLLEKNRRIKLHILERCKLNTTKVSDVLEIIYTPENCNLTVESNIGETDCDNISVTPESENSHQVDFADCDHEQSVTSTSDSKQDDASEIFPPKTHVRLIAHDHHYFDDPETLRTKLAAARKALAEKKKVVRSQQKRLRRMRSKITALELAVSVLQKN